MKEGNNTIDIRLKPKPYGLVTHQTLQIKKFDHEDDWRSAMNAIHARDKEFTAYKWHDGARTYVKLERWD